MGHFFEKNWQRSSSSSTDKLRHMVHKEAPLKPRIAEAIKQLNIPLLKLDSMYQKIQKQNQTVFQKVIDAQKNDETQKASMLATELAEMRKQEKMIENARLALEKIKIRLTTVEDFGEAMIAMQPAMSVVSSIKPSLEKIMPESDIELNAMSGMLGDMMINTLGEDSTDQFDANALPGVEIDSILQEANTMLEKDTDERLPEVPSDIQVDTKTAVYD
jgi:division protein CdvB (Snf7/Vps24/ESCRT-III family)